MVQDNRIIYKMPDGSIRVFCPVRAKRKDEAGVEIETDAEYMADMESKAAQIMAGATKVGVVDKGQMPSGRYFRNAWRWDGLACNVDLSAARSVKMEIIRGERNRRLAESDGLMNKANETGVKIQEWQGYRQALRDIPQNTNLSLILDVPSLEAFSPSWPMKP